MKEDTPSKGPNMSQRAVMQHLSLTEWKTASRLPIRAGEMMLSRLTHYGWIEARGEDHLMQVRLTQAGLNKIRSKI
jgi:hypothetical protein